jgi:hypothetical protein
MVRKRIFDGDLFRVCPLSIRIALADGQRTPHALWISKKRIDSDEFAEGVVGWAGVCGRGGDTTLVYRAVDYRVFIAIQGVFQNSGWRLEENAFLFGGDINALHNHSVLITRQHKNVTFVLAPMKARKVLTLCD